MNLNIVQLLVPQSKWKLKSPYSMKPEGITIHNTANSVSARREASFSAGNTWEVSSHYYVDELEIVQSLPLNRNAWHASDGTYGFGNRNTICIEICRSTGDLGLFKQAEINAVRLTIELMKKFNIPLSKVKRHYDYARDKKYCPHKTMDLGWTRWVNMVKTGDKKPIVNTAEEFIAKISDGAVKGWTTHRILPSLTIAQGMLESANGKSELAVHANAIFGIKAHTDPSWTNTYSKATQEWSNGKLVTVQAAFKAYKNWDESISDRLTYLTTRKINGKFIYLPVIGESDYKLAAQKIFQAGYATDPQYPQKLINIIEKYNLTRFDDIALKGGDVGLKDKIIVAFYNDGDLANALALFNSLGNKAVLVKSRDVTELGGKEVIQVGGAEIKGATKVLMGDNRTKTLLAIADSLR